MRKQIESTQKPGRDIYAKTQEQKEKEKERRTILGRK